MPIAKPRIYLFRVWVDDILPRFLPYEVVSTGTTAEEAKENLIENMKNDGHTVERAEFIKRNEYMILTPSAEDIMSHSMISALSKQLSKQIKSVP